MDGVCIVCGASDRSCGEQHLMFPPIDLSERGASVAEEDKFNSYPQQRTNRGVAGYKNLPKGAVIVEQPKTPTGGSSRVITTQGTTRPRA